MELTLGQADWRKSSYSGGTGNCVEVAGNLPGITAVRDSQDPDGPALILTPAAWRTLTRKVRNGELDLAVTPGHPAKGLHGRVHRFPGRRRTQVQSRRLRRHWRQASRRAHGRKLTARYAAGARGITPGRRRLRSR
jgi:Domain of unknown function (DUF397)